MAKTIEVTLPTLHPAQVAAYRLPGRFKAVRCGRRWGKTDLGKTIACNDVIKKRSVGWFAPDYKIMNEVYNEISDLLEPVKRSSSKIEGVIRTTTGGRLDFWTLENERAGRSRKYHRVIIDEGAFTKPNMMDIWQKSIMPTLLDYRGSAIVMSNTNGIDQENFFWRICNQPEHGFVDYHAPSATNPYLPADELERLERDTPPLVFQQEYKAEFVDWSGVQFFSQANLLQDGHPVEYPTHCDGVFAVIDSATKTGQEHDGTAVTYYAVTRHAKAPLMVLDWDLVQIEGALLETWLPTIFQQLQHLAKLCGARRGSLGTFIEDKSSGMVLIQQAKRRGWPATAIDSKLTSVGKDERAISVSGYVYRNLVRISRPAYDKVTTYHGATRNHWLSQVLGFRIGTKNQEDDLLDTFTYGVALALGDAGGF